MNDDPLNGALSGLHRDGPSARPAYRAELRAVLTDEWHGRSALPVGPPAARSPRRWLIAGLTAAAVVAAAAIGFASRHEVGRRPIDVGVDGIPAPSAASSPPPTLPPTTSPVTQRRPAPRVRSGAKPADARPASANRAPIANDDRVSFRGQFVSLAPLANDVDPEGDTLRVTSVVGSEALVSFSIGTDNTVVVDARNLLPGTTEFRLVYIVVDVHGATASGTVTLVRCPAVPSTRCDPVGATPIGPATQPRSGQTSVTD
jgi:Bacterial Ig domain